MEDLEGWEVLPDDGDKKIFSRKYGAGLNNVFKNYFISPWEKSSQFVESTEHSRVPKQLVHVPIQLEPAVHKIPDHEGPKDVTKIPIQINITPPAMPEKFRDPNTGAVEGDQDPVSQVFFKKMKETEFVDMKMDSPKSNNWGTKPQFDAGTFQLEGKGEAYKGEALESKIYSAKLESDEEEMMKKTDKDSDIKTEETWEENSGGLNVWKWSLTGIGAICSFGVAAATVCIIMFGGRQKMKQHPENQKLQFHIYAEDKRLKQGVHEATKLNEAISAVRGVPLTRAQITVGGYYDGL